MIDLVNFTFDFGGRYLFKDAGWQIKPGERIGLIGQNGTGKSTLLRVISGEYSLSGGSITKAKDVTIGFLNQDLLSYESEESIFHVALSAFQRVMELEDEMNAIYEKMATDHSDALMDRLTVVQTEFDSLDGYNIHHKTEKVLEGLGFSTTDLQRPLKEFSGGWRMRVMLAKLLLQNPSVLLLDEPTNHLDLPSIQWLEEYISSYPGTVIVVSHDRYFLNNMVTKIVHVTGQRLVHYPGNYDDFLEAKAEREEIQGKAFENQQAYIRQQERFIERFKAKASKATQARSKMKQLEKLERVEAVQDDTVEINLRFEVKQASGKVVSRLEDVSKNYGPELSILNKSTAEIVRGDKIALIGANGKGKSTILRMIYGSEPIQGGKISGGHAVNPSFYAQHQLESLNIELPILDELRHHAPTKTDQEFRTVLGCFLFTGEDVFKKIKVLSGGEKARVALAKTLLTQANFLLLDEPTNHLDMQSINILIQALQQYEGTFIVVSHDRYFVQNIANKIWWIEDEQIREYPAGYDEYMVWKAEKEKLETKNPAPKKEVKVEKPKPTQDGNEKKELQKRSAQIEKELELAKAEKEKLEAEMARPEIASNAEELRKLHEAYENITKRCSQLDEEFEELFEKLLSLEN
ncbi:MAG: ABC-F family ATP-binding cassette domain-containing protein [Bacteroidota bacterium]|nr:ABC-F family ATP-binding cassette domain-containing protein [Bacteroidota bacterium]MDX5430165.1 ABC-F family ATP-binding cassette domain-containing protein [Bacteroidota bacterium]MDX5468930.1 ABC-F family ATP-binding cassette domain-containing protein [Bacteroidota bacterium]